MPLQYFIASEIFFPVSPTSSCFFMIPLRVCPCKSASQNSGKHLRETLRHMTKALSLLFRGSFSLDLDLQILANFSSHSLSFKALLPWIAIWKLHLGGPKPGVWSMLKNNVIDSLQGCLFAVLYPMSMWKALRCFPGLSGGISSHLMLLGQAYEFP